MYKYIYMDICVYIIVVLLVSKESKILLIVEYLFSSHNCSVVFSNTKFIYILQ